MTTVCYAEQSSLSQTTWYQGECVMVKDVLECMIKVHEIQGGLSLLNSFNQVGLDHVVLVKVASNGLIPLAQCACTTWCVLESPVGTNPRVLLCSRRGAR
jgi:hypothetical protein